MLRLLFMQFHIHISAGISWSHSWTEVPDWTPQWILQTCIVTVCNSDSSWGVFLRGWGFFWFFVFGGSSLLFGFFGFFFLRFGASFTCKICNPGCWFAFAALSALQKVSSCILTQMQNAVKSEVLCRRLKEMLLSAPRFCSQKSFLGYLATSQPFLNGKLSQP